MLCTVQIEGEFPQILPIRESLIKYVFEPAAEKVQPLPFLLAQSILAWRLVDPAAAEIMRWTWLTPFCMHVPQKEEVKASVRAMRGR